MGKVYRHKPGALDEYLGRVEPESGKVYRHRRGPDDGRSAANRNTIAALIGSEFPVHSWRTGKASTERLSPRGVTAPAGGARGASGAQP